MYQVTTIENIEPLSTNSKHPWFRYIISNNENTITGYRSGKKNEVLNFVRDYARNLNQKYPSRKPRHVNPVQINVSYI